MSTRAAEKSVLIVEVDHRRACALDVQRILTDFGCIIRTRLGIHDGVLDKCSDRGLLVLEIQGPRSERMKLQKELGSLRGVESKAVVLPLSR